MASSARTATNGPAASALPLTSSQTTCPRRFVQEFALGIPEDSTVIRPNLDDTSLIGFGVAHGSLDEVGYLHEVVCDQWNDASRQTIRAWIQACRVKQIVARSRYGHVAVWPFAYVRIEQEMDRFVRNLRAHHMCIVPGDWLPELEALTRLWDVEIL